MAFLKLIRWSNLLTIIITEIIIKYALMDYFFIEAGLSYRLDNILFSIIVISSILIASASNIINDITDIKSDRINNHYKRPLVSGKISLITADVLFYIFAILGVGCSIAAGILAGNIWLFAFQLFVLATLVLYSKKLKCKKLIGNIVVSLATALVPILVWFYTINDTSHQGLMFNYTLRWMHFTIIFFALFAFFSNLIREIIKDREDQKADIAVKCKTWAGQVSLIKFRRTILSLTLFLVILILIFQVLSSLNLVFRLSFVAVQLLLVLGIIPKLMKSSKKEDFHIMSIRMKIVMLVGVLTPVLLYF